MAMKDAIHDQVRQALINNGWTIITEHYTIKYGDDQVFVDLAAERPIAAEKAGKKIMVNAIPLIVVDIEKEEIVQWIR